MNFLLWLLFLLLVSSSIHDRIPESLPMFGEGVCMHESVLLLFFFLEGWEEMGGFEAHEWISNWMDGWTNFDTCFAFPLFFGGL